jgi:hypothetical protein
MYREGFIFASLIFLTLYYAGLLDIKSTRYSNQVRCVCSVTYRY